MTVTIETLAAWLESLGASVSRPLSTVDELFKTASVDSVGSSGPTLGTFFVRFGMTAGAVVTLDAPSLADALRGGLEGVAARGESEIAAELGVAVAAFRDAVDTGADAASAARTAATVARSTANIFDALAAALA